MVYILPSWGILGTRAHSLPSYQLLLSMFQTEEGTGISLLYVDYRVQARDYDGIHAAASSLTLPLLSHEPEPSA